MPQVKPFSRAQVRASVLPPDPPGPRRAEPRPAAPQLRQAARGGGAPGSSPGGPGCTPQPAAIPAGRHLPRLPSPDRSCFLALGRLRSPPRWSPAGQIPAQSGRSGPRRGAARRGGRTCPRPARPAGTAPATFPRPCRTPSGAAGPPRLPPRRSAPAAHRRAALPPGSGRAAAYPLCRRA